VLRNVELAVSAILVSCFLCRYLPYVGASGGIPKVGLLRYPTIPGKANRDDWFLQARTCRHHKHIQTDTPHLTNKHKKPLF